MLAIDRRGIGKRSSGCSCNTKYRGPTVCKLGPITTLTLVLGALVIDVTGEGAFDGGAIGVNKVGVGEFDDRR